MTSSMLANVVSRNAGNFSNTNENRGGYTSRGDGYGGHGNWGGGKGQGRAPGRKFYWQLCGKLGHFADRCYHWYDRNF